MYNNARQKALSLVENNRKKKMPFYTEYKTRLCWIDNNDTLSGESAARHLLCRGYQRIRFIGRLKQDIGSANRLQGVCNVMNSAHQSFEEDHILSGNPQLKAVRK